MEITEIFDKLKDLQKVLSTRYEIEERIVDLPQQLEAQKESLSRYQKEYVEKSKLLDEQKQKVSVLRYQLEDVIAFRAKSEEAWNDVKTNRESEALDKEIKDAANNEQDLRMRLQREEKNRFELDEILTDYEQKIAQQENDLLDIKQTIDIETANLRKELTQLKKQENEISADLDEELKFKFERIARSKHSKGIVPLKNKVCDGCHMLLPAQFANKVRDGEEIVFCPYCSRILYYEESDEGESEFFQYNDTGSLADDDSFYDDAEYLLGGFDSNEED